MNLYEELFQIAKLLLAEEDGETAPVQPPEMALAAPRSPSEGA